MEYICIKQFKSIELDELVYIRIAHGFGIINDSLSINIDDISTYFKTIQEIRNDKLNYLL